MQHPPLVPRELPHLDQAGVLPHAQLVLAVAVAAQDLTLVAVPLQGADLGEEENVARAWMKEA